MYTTIKKVFVNKLSFVVFFLLHWYILTLNLFNLQISDQVLNNHCAYSCITYRAIECLNAEVWLVSQIWMSLITWPLPLTRTRSKPDECFIHNLTLFVQSSFGSFYKLFFIILLISNHQYHHLFWSFLRWC